MKPHAILSSWLTAVDKKFVVNYFKQLKKDLPDMKVFAGGAQIKSNSKDLKGLIIEVQDIPELIEQL